ncbi:MAG: T9SS type A sorting domain-containing protein, partial [Chlorobi bacterium]|nr:T9SS type A sorting domain-containing protein [Chlorobiota bacterium]
SVLIASILMFSGQLFSQNTLTGTYYYHADTSLPIPGVQVRLYDMNDSLIASDLTNIAGQYTLAGIPSGQYSLKSATDMESVGVDLNDANLVFYYLIGWSSLDSIQYQVADVDASEEVDWIDLGLIYINYLINGQPFPGGDWDFETVSLTFASRAAGDTTTVDPWGSSYGDVEGEWEPTGRDINILPTEYYSMEMPNKQETAKFVVAANYDGDLDGFQVNLSYASEKLNILSISGPDENFNYSVDNKSGVIKANWLNLGQSTSMVDGNELFTIEIAGNNEGQISDGELISLLPGSMLLDTDDNKLDNTEIKLPLFKNKQLLNVEVNTYPNPVVSNINFNVRSSSEFSQASLVVYDLTGKKVFDKRDISVREGEQVISLDAKGLLPGNYIFSLNLKGDGVKNIRGRFVKSK